LELWQAVVLSLGFQPTADLESLATRDWNVSRARDARDFRRIRGYDPPVELPAEFWDRLRRCQTNLSKDGPIRPQGDLYQGMLTSPRCAVTLAEVAAFLGGAGYTLPEALKAAPAPADVPAVADETAPSKAKHSEPAAESPPLEHWKMRVQAEAAAEWMRLRAMGCNPTKASIRPHLLKWCQENNVKTSGNINPGDGYLRTHVLGGNHWTPPAD